MGVKWRKLYLNNNLKNKCNVTMGGKKKEIYHICLCSGHTLTHIVGTVIYVMVYIVSTVI